jgi:hypothetical protein
MEFEPAMLIEVDTAADAKGRPTPSSIRLDGRNIDVADVIDQWSSVDYRYFKVKDAAGNIYILHLDEPRAAWELVMFLSKRGAAIPDLMSKRVSMRSLPVVDGKV